MRRGGFDFLALSGYDLPTYINIIQHILMVDTTYQYLIENGQLFKKIPPTWGYMKSGNNSSQLSYYLPTGINYMCAKSRVMSINK